jgi:hypothetical protein
LGLSSSSSNTTIILLIGDELNGFIVSGTNNLMSHAIIEQSIGFKTAIGTVDQIGMLVGVTKTGKVHKDIVVVSAAASRI